MTDIELVIKIPEEIRLALINNIQLSICDLYIKQAIINGTPLPKGHGDLIDRSNLEVHYIGTDIDTDCPVYLLPTVDEAPPIIEADKEVGI